jgi:F-type H+-transporting ATPase subunit delta
MPGSDVSAKRYAQAAFAIASEAGSVEAWGTALNGLRDLMAEPTVSEYLQTSKVEEAEKFAVLDQALGGVEPGARSLAKLLVRKRRIEAADHVAAAFEDLRNTARGVTKAQVTTATALNEAGRAAIAGAVRGQTGAAEVQLEERVDREILGGAIVRIGDHIIDGSVRTRLRGLRRSIAGSIG